MAVNISLIKNNLSPLSFVDVPTSDYISGLLAIYELNKVELFRDIFIWAFERSAKQYQVLQNTLGEPNLLGMKFRNELFTLIRHIIQNNIHGEDIINTVETWSKQHIDHQYQKQFIQHTEKEIASLHEGNIAIYRIQLDEFSRWKPSQSD